MYIRHATIHEHMEFQHMRTCVDIYLGMQALFVDNSVKLHLTALNQTHDSFIANWITNTLDYFKAR